MTTYTQNADQSTVALSFVLDAKVDTPIQERTLYPLKRLRMSMPEYRLRQGIPYPVPAIDVRSETTVTASAATVTNNRPSPLQVAPTSLARWLPTAATYSGGTWSALAGGTRSFISGTTPPERTDTYTYYVGKELITRSAMIMNTDLKQYFESDFTPETEDEWTFLVVAVPLPPNRNVLGQSDYYGVIETKNGDEVGLRQYASSIQYHQDVTYNTTKLALGASAPAIYAISVTPTTVRFYRRSLGTTWKLTLARTLTGQWHTTVRLGAIRGTANSYTANMALMEVNFYNTRLNDDEFELEASNIYSAYGNYAGE